MASGGGAGDALSSLVDQTFENIKNQTPAFEELHRHALRYQHLLEQTSEVAAVFADQLSRVAVTAARSRGDTASLGQDFHHLAQCHKTRATEQAEQASKLSTQFVAPLGKRLKSDGRAHTKMEDDFKSVTKNLRSDLKKANQQLVKAQKQASKNTSGGQGALEQATQTLQQRNHGYEDFNKRFLRTVLIEERRRFCYLIDNYLSVFGVDFRNEDEHTAVQDILARCAEPEELPRESMELIDANSNLGVRRPSASDPTILQQYQQHEQQQHAPMQRQETKRYIPRGGVAIDMLRAQQGTATEF